MSQLFADAHPLTIDAEGRIVLPETLKEHAQISDEVAFVGLGAMFQIWEPGALRRAQRRSARALAPPGHDIAAARRPPAAAGRA